ncbi:hypothetical protein BKA70DRAFT_1491229 [Coprinopsis sp. MPI-PUGE-AT-0042]|nr:hypothetical protein BKA70DRAFT_1491229 [Coprinopsis sp. MPI-PUGE-AT-0042]
MSKEGSMPEQRLAYKTALGESLRAGYAILKEGGDAMDAAVAAVVSLEDNPLFNAGKGAVFNTAGKLARAIYLVAPREGDPTHSTVSEDYVPESSSGAVDHVLPATTNIVDNDASPSIPHPLSQAHTPTLTPLPINSVSSSSTPRTSSQNEDGGNIGKDWDYLQNHDPAVLI